MKKILSVIISLSIILSVTAVGIPTVYGANTEQSHNDKSGMWSYKSYDYEGVAGVTLTAYAGSASDVYVPATIETDGGNMPILKIGDGLFQNNTTVNSVTLGNGIKVIGENAFSGASGLVCIVTDEELTEIGANAFNGCTSFNSVILYDGIECIGDNAFAGCKNLTIYCSEGTVGYEYAQSNGIDTEILNPDAIPEIYTVDEITYYIMNGEAIAISCASASAQIDVPATVKGYPVTELRSTFKNCTGLKNVILPDGIKRIGESAFYGCSNLISIEIPNGVTTISNNAFSCCEKLTEVMLPDGVTYIGEGAFSSCSNLISIEIPNGVTTISDNAFSWCKKLIEIMLPDDVTFIGYGAFCGCRSLTKITIPNSVTLIEPWTFDGCRSLTKITIPDGVTSIGYGAFSGCRSLTEITIPNSVTYIDGETFNGCTNLAKMLIPKSVTAMYTNSFPSTTVLLVYENSYAHKFAQNNDLLYFVLQKTKNPEIAYGAEISGKAVYTDGTPVANSTVDILYDDGTLKESVTTDENGLYSFTYAEVGRYTIRVTDSEGRSGSEQISVKRKNVFDVFLAGTTDITVKSSWSVSGTVTPQGTACITLTDTDRNIITSVQTDNGEYIISGVPNGSYIIRAENENGSAVKEITVFNRDVNGTDILIEQQAASIEGYVEVEDRNLNRIRRNWVQITVYNSEGTVVVSGKTDEDGKYSFSNLPFDSYSIVAEATEVRPEHKKNYKRAFTLTGYAYITLSEAKLYTVDTIVLTEESDDVAVISGKVTAHGQSQAGEVILTNVFRNEIARCSVGNNGKYSFSNVPNGLYFITAVTESDGMGFAAVTVRNGTVYGDTNITVYKGQKIIEHEEYMRNIPHCENREEALAYKDRIMEEKSFYDGLPEKEKKQLSHEYIEILNRLSEYISSYECSANGGELSQGGMIISADELNSEEPVQLELNIEKRDPWTIGEDGIQTDEEFMQQSIEDVKGDKTSVQYYDITLSKNVGGVEKKITDVKKDTDTTGKIRITLPIPEEYKGHKNYSFVHVHNGRAVMLVDLDDDPNTVTFEIDKFSTFVLTYSDKENTDEFSAEISYKDGQITVDSEKPGNVFIASYINGKLISVKKHKVDEESYFFDNTNAAFVWDENMKPLCKKFTISQ